MNFRSDTDFPGLSARELQLLTLAMGGHTDASIANHLEISEATVSTYWGRIRIKLGPHSRTELVAIYLQHETAKTLEQLKAENERLSREASAGKGLWRELMANAPDAIFVVREDGIIESANEQAADLFGYEKDELALKPVSLLMPERYRETHDAHRAMYVDNPEKKKMGEHLSTLALRKDGTEFLIAAALNVTKSDSGLLITCIVREVEQPEFVRDQRST